MAIRRATTRIVDEISEIPDIDSFTSNESAPQPKRKTRSVKTKSTSTPINFDSLPDTMVIRMSDTVLTIAQLLIEHFDFNTNINTQTLFISKLYAYNREVENKTNFALIIRKNSKSVILDTVPATTEADIAESRVLEALSEFKLHCSKISNNASYDEIKYFISCLTSYVFPSSNAKINPISGDISINQQRVNSNIQMLNGTLLEPSAMMYQIGDYAVIKNVNSQSILLVNKNFPFSSQGVIATTIKNSSTSYIPFNDLKTKYEYLTDIGDFNQQKLYVVTRSETKYSKTYLREQIRTRYFMPRPNRGNHTNIVVDSYLPYQLYQDNTDSYDRNFNLSKASSTECHYAVSRLAADILKATPISIDTLCKIVGFTQKQIKDLLTKVKSKDIYPVFVGAGGTNMNTLYWLNELCSYANVMNLFTRGISIHEPEQIEFSNMLRFPMPLSAYTSINLRENAAPYKTLLLHSLKNITTSMNIVREYVTSNTIKSYCSSGTDTLIKGVVFYGAPDIHSRKLLAPYGNFIAATHANNSCSIWLNPIQNSDIQVESYGLIQLNTFFINQFRMAIEFLSILASNLDLTIADTRLFSYAFNGIPENTIDRKLYWQIEQNMEMTPEL